MRSKEEKLSVLSELAAEFHRQNLLWAVGASLLLYLKGYVEDFHDIDLMVAHGDAEKMETILKSRGSLQPSTRGSFATKHFREFLIHGVDVDMLGGFAIVRDGKVYDCDLKPWQISDYTEVNGQKIPLQSVELWREYYLLMGREKKVEIIDHIGRRRQKWNISSGS